MLYRFDRVRKSYGSKEVLRDVTWQHNPGEKVGLVGRNGAGKTTLLRLALGREEGKGTDLFFEGKGTDLFFTSEGKGTGKGDRSIFHQ